MRYSSGSISAGDQLGFVEELPAEGRKLPSARFADAASTSSRENRKEGNNQGGEKMKTA